MNPDQIKQIIETVKTLNINFNDATTQKIADAILPVVKLYLIKGIIEIVLVLGVVCFVAILIYKFFSTLIANEKELNLKRIEKDKNDSD